MCPAARSTIISGHDERAHPGRPALPEHGDLVLHRLEAADAGADDDAGPRRELVVDLGQACVGERLVGGDDSELLEARHAALLLDVDDRRGVEVVEVAAESRRVLRSRRSA